MGRPAMSAAGRTDLRKRAAQAVSMAASTVGPARKTAVQAAIGTAT